MKCFGCRLVWARRGALQLYLYTDSKNSCSLQTGRPRCCQPARCAALLAERLLLWLSLARLGARGQHRCLSGASLPVSSPLPRPSGSSPKAGGSSGGGGGAVREEDAGAAGGPAAPPAAPSPYCGRCAPPGTARPGPGDTPPGGAPRSKGTSGTARPIIMVCVPPSPPTPSVSPVSNSLCGSRPAGSSLPWGCWGTLDAARQPRRMALRCPNTQCHVEAAR